MTRDDSKPGRAKFPRIFEERKVGPFVSRNRVKYAACSVSNFNHRDGSISERELARMGVVARTGCGIITNQGVYPDPRGEGKAYYRMLALHDDRFIEGLAKVCKMLHAGGAIAIQQILHGGRYGGADLDYCLQPSAVPQSLRHFRPPREMTVAEIEQTIEDHAQAARRCMEAGFDGVEITAFMGYLVADFLSSFTNKRTDRYGGSVENRARFLVELLQAIREQIGREKLLVVRLNAVELMDEYGGSTPDECLEFMQIAEKQAGVDMISIVIGWHEARTGALARDLPPDRWVEDARRVKEVVSVPVAFGVRLRDSVLAERFLEEEVFDFWEVCRPFLADPELLHKLEEDRLDEAKPCIAGLTCLARMFNNLPYICTVNPRLGHEVDPAYSLEPTSVPKKVMVVGGGVAGLELAATAVQRGHQVSLYERRDRLGGQVLMADREPSAGKSYMGLIEQYAVRLERHGASVRLGCEVDRQVVAEERPDVVVLATGARVPRFDDAAAGGLEVVSLEEALIDDAVEPGARVAILSGERAGLVTAEHLAQKGCRVSLIEEGKRVGTDVSITFIWRHRAWLEEMDVQVLTGHRLAGVEGGRLRLTGPGGEEVGVEVDVLIQAGPRRSCQDLAGPFSNLADELYLIGDAVMPRSITEAIHEGYKLGLRI
jgi:2,4-dienoyl-CoA reductase (NADPH2)